MVIEFQPDTKNDRGLLCCLPTYSPLGDVNNNSLCQLTSNWIYVSWSFKHEELAKGKKIKRERWVSPWLKHKVKHKVKDRPFAEGSKRCHVRLGLDAWNLNAKERHFILPLVCGPLLCNSSLLLLPQQVRTKLIFSALISHTYLESNFYCLHRWQLTWRILLNP